jgi:uncharacterized protein YndB with AHSA1/START domain
MTIRKSLTVRCPPERAFQVFTRKIGSWWPLRQGFSMRPRQASAIFLEDRVGGRFYERLDDGTEIEIGRVTGCRPPHLIRFTFRGPAWEAATDVELRFTAAADGTRVELEHHGFETEPDMRRRGRAFEGGWDTVLACYLEAAND